MKKLNFKKLETYTQSLKSLPLTEYRINRSKKLFLLMGFMLFEFIILSYLFSMLIHIILAIIVAFLVWNRLHYYNLSFLVMLYSFLFKNDKKMMECVDE